MGEVVPIADAAALAQAVLRIVDEPERYRRDPAEFAAAYGPDFVAAEYERLFERLTKK
jgi:glycosyltransferase involved in cell wall biosynthesis